MPAHCGIHSPADSALQRLRSLDAVHLLTAYASAGSPEFLCEFSGLGADLLLLLPCSCGHSPSHPGMQTPSVDLCDVHHLWAGVLRGEGGNAYGNNLGKISSLQTAVLQCSSPGALQVFALDAYFRTFHLSTFTFRLSPLAGACPEPGFRAESVVQTLCTCFAHFFVCLLRSQLVLRVEKHWTGSGARLFAIHLQTVETQLRHSPTADANASEQLTRSLA